MKGLFSSWEKFVLQISIPVENWIMNIVSELIDGTIFGYYFCWQIVAISIRIQVESIAVSLEVLSAFCVFALDVRVLFLALAYE